MYTFVYVRLVIGFFLLRSLRDPPPPIPRSGKNTGPNPLESDFKKVRFQRADVDMA